MQSLQNNMRKISTLTINKWKKSIDVQTATSRCHHAHSCQSFLTTKTKPVTEVSNTADMSKDSAQVNMFTACLQTVLVCVDNFYIYAVLFLLI